ncbi:hypothetical protein ABBQ38_006306 [Trebouxia sp. C0009 RCD-2024]
MLDRVTRLAKHCIQYCAAMQGPLLANYSQSFIEQLRNASLPYANSSVGLKQRLHFEDNSRLQRFLVWLKLAVKRISWGAAAAHHKRKDLVLRYIAERMHLRHPNLVTVMGFSAEPITDDPLLVSALALACPFASCLDFVLDMT